MPIRYFLTDSFDILKQYRPKNQLLKKSHTGVGVRKAPKSVMYFLNNP